MSIAFYILLLFLALFIAQEIFRRFPRFTLGLFLIMPFFLTLHWLNLSTIDWFSWFKMFSMTIAVIWFSIFKLGYFNNKFGKNVIYIILVINILGAILKDYSGGSLLNYLNVYTGILLVVTIDKIDSINVSKNKYQDVSWDGMTLAWIIGHTIWDWTFIYLNFSSMAFLHIAVLGAPLAVAFLNKGRWLQARAFTLGAYIFSLPFIKLTLPAFDFSQKSQTLEYLLSFGAFIFMFIYAVKFFRMKIFKKDNLCYNLDKSS